MKSDIATSSFRMAVKQINVVFLIHFEYGKDDKQDPAAISF